MATNSESSGKGPRKAVLGIVGGTTLTLAGERLFHGKRKILALISYMVLSPQESVSREFLAGLLWSDVSDTQAGDSLRQLFVELRRVFRQSDFPLLKIYKDTVTTNRELVETDIDDIFQHLGEGRVTQLLASKASLSADILYGFDDLSSNFSQWLFDFRAAFHDRLMRGLQDGYQSEKFSATSRQHMAEIAIGLDAVHEESHRFAMHLAASNGDIGTALQVYTKLYNALDEELGMEPSAKTQALVVKIKTGHFDNIQAHENTGQGKDEILKSNANPCQVASGIPTVAVLPFATLGPDPVPRYFSMGILEDTVCQLATLREPRVISSNSTRNIDVSESGTNAKLIAMGVSYFVSGSINKSGDNYHLSVQLSDIKSGIVEWAKVYDTSGDKLFEVQNEIACSISQKLVPSLRLAELRRTDSSRVENLTAYHLTLRGRDLAFRLERDTYDEAGELLQLACQKDPRFAPTFVALADWYSVRLGQGWSLDAAQDQMLLEKAMRAAISLGGESSRALAMLGHNKTILSQDYDEAKILFERALTSAPNDAESLMWSSPTFAFVGDHSEASDRAEQAIALSPQDPYLFRFEHFLSIAKYSAREYEEAAYWGRSSFQRNPLYFSNLRTTAAALVAADKLDEARIYAGKVMEQDAKFKVSNLMKAHPFKSDRNKSQYADRLITAGLPA